MRKSDNWGNNQPLQNGPNNQNTHQQYNMDLGFKPWLKYQEHEHLLRRNFVRPQLGWLSGLSAGL